MANISSYPQKQPKGGDVILFSETYDAEAANPVVGNPTKTATAQSIANLASSSTVLGYAPYTVLLNQSGTNAPVATQLQNKTTGTFNWTYVSLGRYAVTAVGVVMPASKTIVFFNNGSSSSINPNLYWSLDTGGNSIGVRCDTNGILTSASFEIRIYE